MNRLFFSSLKDTGIIKNIYRKPRLNDEPKLYGFGGELDVHKLKTDGELPDPYSSGTSQDEMTALLRAIFEGVERFNLAEFRFRDFVFNSYKDISKSHVVVAPRHFCYFRKKQIINLPSLFSYSDQAKFYWVKCKNFQNDEEVYLPAQTIYCPYKYQNAEKVLTFPITTGSSIAQDQDEAIYKGFCEVIERDAFMTNYLLKLHPLKIVYEAIENEEIVKLQNQIEKYMLEISSYILVSDLKIPTVLSVIIDRAKKGPALCIGLKTDWNLSQAIIGSMEEACQIRQWIRLVMVEGRWKDGSYSDKSMLQRAFIWKDASSLNKLDFILDKCTSSTKLLSMMNMNLHLSPTEKLNLIKNEFKRGTIQAYYKDVTSKTLKNIGLTAVKCVAPDLHPMFIDQKYPYVAGRRLEQLMRKYNVKSINTYPHPFL